MVRRAMVISIAVSLLLVQLAAADPGLEVRYFDNIAELTLTGDFGGSQYSIWRAPALDGPYQRIVENTLCFGVCYGNDSAPPGTTVWYRFDLIRPDGTPVSYGPFSVTFPVPLHVFHASVYPNPGAGATHVDLSYSGASSEPAVSASAILFDLQGRKRRTLWNGALRTGLTRLNWDGRDDDGRMLDPGRYFLRFTTPRGTTVFRVVRVR